MNAPKEYYPVGYEKNFDDNFTTKVDLPPTSFHCGDQKHFPGLYGDIDLGCMVMFKRCIRFRWKIQHTFCFIGNVRCSMCVPSPTMDWLWNRFCVRRVHCSIRPYSSAIGGSTLIAKPVKRYTIQIYPFRRATNWWRRSHSFPITRRKHRATVRTAPMAMVSTSKHSRIL